MMAFLFACFLLIAIIVLLNLAFRPNQPGGSRLAGDFAKLGFVPGKPVSLPPGLIAECRMPPYSYGYKVYRFANGLVVADAENHDGLVKLTFDTPTAPPSNTEPVDDQGILGLKIPLSQRTSLLCETWGGKGLFLLNRADFARTYGPPSLIWDGKDMFEYVYQIKDNEYESVRVIFDNLGTPEEAVWGINMAKFNSTKTHPLSQYKVYPWPGLYPAPGK
jgi:hypothetical protein